MTKTFGLIGKSLGHSFSKKYFESKFEKEGLTEFEYKNFELSRIEEVKDLLTTETNLKGFNVTIPYKEEIIPFLDELSEEASAIGAVNTVLVSRNEQGIWLKGHNTDAGGFHQSIKPFLESKHERALVFGTGGASKAVIYILKKLGVDVCQVSRIKTPATITYEEINEYVLQSHLLLINTTPVGMYPKTEEVLPLPFEYLTPNHFVCDLIYNPPKTRLLEQAALRGATILNGESMLIHQAEQAWYIWSNQQV